MTDPNSTQDQNDTATDYTPSEAEVEAAVRALAPFFPPDTVIDPDAVEEGEYVLASLEQIVSAVLVAAHTVAPTDAQVMEAFGDMG